MRGGFGRLGNDALSHQLGIASMPERSAMTPFEPHQLTQSLRHGQGDIPASTVYRRSRHRQVLPLVPVLRRCWSCQSPHTRVEGIAMAQSCASFLSTGVITAVESAGSVGWPVPIHKRRVFVRCVRWKMNEGEPGNGEGRVVWSMRRPSIVMSIVGVPRGCSSKSC